MMHKRILSAALVGLLLNVVCSAQSETDPTPQQIKAAAKVRSKVLDLGVGAHVRVRLLDGTEYKGYLTEVTFEEIVIEGGEVNVPTRLTYYKIRDVRTAKSRGRKIGEVAGFVIFFGMIAANIVGYARK
jgi:hypothetical protein